MKCKLYPAETCTMCSECRREGATYLEELLSQEIYFETHSELWEVM